MVTLSRASPVPNASRLHCKPAYYVLTTAEASSMTSPAMTGVRYGYLEVRRPFLISRNSTKLARSEGFGKRVKRRIMLGTFVLSTGYYDAYLLKHSR